MCVTNTTNQRAAAVAAARKIAKMSEAAAKELMAAHRQPPKPIAAPAAFPTATVATFPVPSQQYSPTPVVSNGSFVGVSPISYMCQQDDLNGNHFCQKSPGSLGDGAMPSQQQPKRRKRRRKPQKPGKTAKMFDRHFVVHNYHDHAYDTPESVVERPKCKRRGGVSMSFPQKLHSMLDQIEDDGLAHVISWMPHGRCFVIHKPKEFVSHVMPKYFKQSKLTSFQRQLNLYGFQRLTKGPDDRGYYHELFLRGKHYLCKGMVRTKVKGTGFKAASSPDQEPDFYKMPPVLADNSTSETAEALVQLRGDTYSLNPRPEAQMSYQQTYVESSSSSTEEFAHDSSGEVSGSSVSGSVSGWSSPGEESEHEEHCDSSMSTEDMFQPAQTDPILDRVVDELFLHEPPEDEAVISSFVKSWDPNSQMAMDPDVPIEDDLQLGNLLETFLAEHEAFVSL